MLILMGMFFIQFTIRGYTKVENNIYIDKDFNWDSSKVLSIIDESHKRLATFWGPTIIINDNENKLRKLGWTGESALTTTAIFFGAHSVDDLIALINAVNGVESFNKLYYTK